MGGHKKIHSFTGNTDHDFTGLIPGQLITFNGSGLTSSDVSLPPLEAVLSEGNETNGKDIKLTEGDKITNADENASLDLSDGKVILDAETGVEINSDSVTISDIDGTITYLNVQDGFTEINNQQVDIKSDLSTDTEYKYSLQTQTENTIILESTVTDVNIEKTTKISITNDAMTLESNDVQESTTSSIFVNPTDISIAANDNLQQFGSNIQIEAKTTFSVDSPNVFFGTKAYKFENNTK